MNKKIVSTVFQSDYSEQAKQMFENLDVSEATRLDYKYRIGAFADFIVSEGFDRSTLLRYKRYLSGRNDWSLSSKNKNLIVAKIFIKELYRLGKIPTDISVNVKVFGGSKRHKREGLNDEEMLHLIEKLHQLPVNPSNARLKAIISLLALAGLRLIELTRLDVTDLDLANMTANVHGKGQLERELVHLQPEIIKTLKEYVKLSKVASGPLFTSMSNNSRNARLTTRSLRRIVQTLFDELKIPHTPHSMRHWFTTTLISSYKGDLLEVMRYTRHKTIEMLTVYNDNLKRKADLPRYYHAFKDIKF